jgi:hypothetical protein
MSGSFELTMFECLARQARMNVSLFLHPTNSDRYQHRRLRPVVAHTFRLS